MQPNRAGKEFVDESNLVLDLLGRSEPGWPIRLTVLRRRLDIRPLMPKLRLLERYGLIEFHGDAVCLPRVPANDRALQELAANGPLDQPGLEARLGIRDLTPILNLLVEQGKVIRRGALIIAATLRQRPDGTGPLLAVVPGGRGGMAAAEEHFA